MSQELTEVQQQQVTVGLAPNLAERQELINSYNEVIKMELTEENLPKFKALRLQLVKNRTAIGNWKTTEKAFYLAGGNFVQAIYNKEIAVNKEMESKLLEGEQHFQRLEAQRLEKLRSERWEKLQKFTETEPAGLSLIEEDMFSAMLMGAETAYKQKIEAERKAEEERLESERKVKLYDSRKLELMPYWDFLHTDHKSADFGELPNESYIIILDEVQQLKLQHDKEQERIKLENEQLKKEREEVELRAKELEIERKKVADAEALKRKEEESKKQAILDKEKAKQDAILKKEREEKAKLEAELKAKKEAELEAINNKRLEDLKAKEEAEKLAKAPVKNQMNAWLETFNFEDPTISNDTTLNILTKFDSFLGWAKTEIEKI